MKSIKLFFAVITLSLTGLAQEDSKTLHETAKTFMRQGDFDNAIIVLNRALQKDNDNIEMQKDLVQSYYYKRDYTKALHGVESLLDRNEVDVVSFQIAGNVYKALEDPKEAEKVYKRGLKKFPKSGALFSEYGELLWAKKDYSAIAQYEKGIEVDPTYAGNYYNAALYYYYIKDKVWTLIYGEIFVNMESLTERALAMKQLLFNAYKEKLFAEADLSKGNEKNKSEFAKAFLQTMDKQASLADKGVNTEILTMIRTRFILEWFENYASRFPFRLFDYHRQLLQEGMFEAYNQWLFGTIENLSAYDAWTKTHSDEYTAFTNFQKGRIFKIPAGQYYK